MNDFKAIESVLRQGRKAILCGHSMPDGDSIGSVLAMNFLLEDIGVESYMVMNDQFPNMYRFLPGSEKYMRLDQISGELDLAVILDCTDLGRLDEELGKYISRIPTVVNIDHHVSNNNFGTVNFVDDKASSTGEIVYELAKSMGVNVTKEMAAGIYTAIVMDTGSFMFENTSARTHEITSELIRTGINTVQINKHLFETKSFIQFKLLGYALNNMKTTADGRIAWISIPLDVMRNLGAEDEHVEGIVNYPRMINGVEIGLLFREIEPRIYKVGFRSKNYVDVNKLAAEFGGGGHQRAAGCKVEGTLKEVEERVIAASIQAL